MFVLQAKYDEIVRQMTEVTEENNRLQGLVAGATDHATQITALTSEKEAISAQVVALTAEKDSLAAQVESLTSKVTTLTSENETLRVLPGAKPATTVSTTENPSGGSMTDLEKLNEFCKANSADVNACTNAINLYNNQVKK